MRVILWATTVDTYIVTIPVFLHLPTYTFRAFLEHLLCASLVSPEPQTSFYSRRFSSRGTLGGLV